ncbi:hypothetical protein D3C81_1206610 [compost metagenome]
MFQGGGQGGHCRCRQLQSLDQGAVGEQVTLPPGVLEFLQPLPVSTADVHAQEPDPALTPKARRNPCWMASLASRSPFSISSR